jgi:5-methylcytosine-specific restriction endonuclease McrA
MPTLLNKLWSVEEVSRRPDLSGVSYVKLVRKDPCSYCGSNGGTADHIMPSVDGGHNGWDNLTGACFECNIRKGAMHLLMNLLFRPIPA